MIPTVSIIMSTFNGAQLVRATIASVLAQTFTDWELVIVDDGSSDDTLAILRGYDDPRLVVIAADVNGGPVAARNRAMAAARGRYIAGLDQDDLCRPDRLARQVAYLDAYPQVVLVGSIAEQLQNGRRWIPGQPATTPDFLDWALLIENPIAWSSTMFRGEAARALAPFERAEMIYAEDFDLYHRLRRFGRIARIDAPLITYRIHGAGISRNNLATMHAAVAHLLTDAYAPILGDAAPEMAIAIHRYATTDTAAPDAATITRVIGAIGRLRRHVLDSCTDAASRRLIDEDYARYWRFMVRIAVRAGTVGLGAAFATRPNDIPMRHAVSAGILGSPLIRHVRRRAPVTVASALT